MRNFLLHLRSIPHNPSHVMKLFDLTGEVAVVIGATGVLGGAIAEGLAEAGAQIAVLGRNAERGNARVKAVQANGGKAAFFPCDAISRSSLGRNTRSIWSSSPSFVKKLAPGFQIGNAGTWRLSD